ncbi:MAG: ROK family protein [Ignavibacteriae bacterium]|nr:ROK family protein [Ignavibacteriota bacterium]NOG96676.1 ROK family protein [Ignavibacteriota bacterium]
MALLALDLNSSYLTIAILGRTGKILSRNTTKFIENTDKDVIDLIKEGIASILDEYDNKVSRIKVLGISIPGIYYPKTGCVWAPNIQGWEDFPLKKELIPLIQKYKLQIKIASKRTCNILGEQWLGSAKGLKNAIYFSVSKGIGAGILIDGKILHGYSDGVGSLGWLCLNTAYKESYSERGFFEYHASGSGMINYTRELLSKRKKHSGYLSKFQPDEIDINMIFDAYAANDTIAVKVIKHCIDYWGIASANLINLFNPEKIIFGGLVFGPGQKYLSDIKEEASKWAHPQFSRDVDFIVSQLGNRAALFGAGQLVNKLIKK